VILPRAFIHQREFAEAVERVEQKLRESGQVVRVRHDLDYDSTGEPAVYFRIVMPDSSFADVRLLAATDDVANALIGDLDPLERWGVYPYFRYRSQSGQEATQEPSWA
jgi:hypothetical protein